MGLHPSTTTPGSAQLRKCCKATITAHRANANGFSILASQPANTFPLRHGTPSCWKSSRALQLQMGVIEEGEGLRRFHLLVQAWADQGELPFPVHLLLQGWGGGASPFQRMTMAQQPGRSCVVCTWCRTQCPQSGCGDQLQADLPKQKPSWFSGHKMMNSTIPLKKPRARIPRL